MYLYYYCAFWRRRRVNSRDESEAAKHNLSSGGPDAEGRCLGEGVNYLLISERMRGSWTGRPGLASRGIGGTLWIWFWAGIEIAAAAAC